MDCKAPLFPSPRNPVLISDEFSTVCQQLHLHMLLHSIFTAFLMGRDHNSLLWMRKVGLRVAKISGRSGFKPRPADAHCLCRGRTWSGREDRQGVVRPWKTKRSFFSGSIIVLVVVFSELESWGWGQNPPEDGTNQGGSRAILKAEPSRQLCW